MNKKHKVNLSGSQRLQLLDLVKKGSSSAREIRRAHTLLMADSGSTDEAIAKTLHISVNTIERTRKQPYTKPLNQQRHSGLLRS